MSCPPLSAAPQRPFLLSSGEGRFVVDPVALRQPIVSLREGGAAQWLVAHRGDRAARPAFGGARPPVDVRCFRCFVVRRRAGGQNPGVLARKLGVFWRKSAVFSRKLRAFFACPPWTVREARQGGYFLPDTVRWARVCVSSSPPSRCHFRVDRRCFPAGTARPVPTARQKGWGSRQMRFSPSIDYKKRRLIT